MEVNIKMNSEIEDNSHRAEEQADMESGPGMDIGEKGQNSDVTYNSQI